MQNEKTQYKVGELVKLNLVGIVYEDGSQHKSVGRMRIQTADGTKIRYLQPSWLEPATAEDAEKFKAEAIPGLTPEEIIEREAPKEPIEDEDEDE